MQAISTDKQIAIGIVLILLGFSFAYKAYLAIIRGKLTYWQGFLPFTIISPFLVHLPRSKRSLITDTEGLWVHLVFGPIFSLLAFLCIAAGLDLSGLPGTSTLNLALHGGKEGSPYVMFSRSYGYRFPIVSRVAPQLKKIFGSQIGLSQKDNLINQDNNTSYDQAASQNK